MLFDSNLPIIGSIPEICRALENGRNAVLQAPPGAGKTTIVPLALLNEPWLSGKKIVMLEPRRLAARAAAYRMASLLNEDAGATVGYRTRMDSRISPATGIEVVTEGILTRLLQVDPALEGTGILIFDEFHERSIHADLGLALSLEAQSVFREDLRILVMSATLNGREVSTLLGNAPIIKSEGRAYPVEVRYLPQQARPERTDGMTGPAFITKAVSAILSALKDEDGSVLVFLPGAGEIRRVEAALKERGVPADVDIVPLYGDLPREAQDFAIRPSRAGRRKVVIATSIAETSITIEGIRVVIDGGLMRVPRFSPDTGMGALETIRVTKDSAEQRCGRAGRTGPGVCLRLWTEAENGSLRDRGTPEIMESDLMPLSLELAVWGVKDANKLKWLDNPPEAGMSQAKEILAHLGAIKPDGSATAHGRDMARLPLHPRLGHMVLKAREAGLGNLACHMASLITERDIVKLKQGQTDSDIRHRLDLLFGHTVPGLDFDRNLCERIMTAARQIKKQLDIKDSSNDVNEAGLLLAYAYPDRIGKKRPGGGGKYLLSNGRGALFRDVETISNEEYIVAASLEGGGIEARIFLAAPIKSAELEERFKDAIKDNEVIEWDQSQKAVVMRKQRRLWSLVLSDSPLQDADKEKLLHALLSGIRQNGLGVLPWDKAAENLKERVLFLHAMEKEIGMSFPAMDDAWLLANLERWLGPWVDGITRLEQLKKLDLKQALLGVLSWEEQKALERLAPTHFTVPTGSRIHIDYTAARPALSVRIQEVFGLDKTPSIADGKVRLVMHLLSPANRPVQVTEDLAGFWKTSYAMVKKELKGRYPKHYWPDDPLQAEPRRGVKR